MAALMITGKLTVETTTDASLTVGSTYDVVLDDSVDVASTVSLSVSAPAPAPVVDSSPVADLPS